MEVVQNFSNSIEKGIVQRIFHNLLIMETIFAYLPLENLYPLRLVCRNWNELISKQISGRFNFEISERWKSRMQNITRNLTFFKELKLSCVTMKSWPGSGSREILKLIQIFQVLSISGRQIRTLKLLNVKLGSEDFAILGNLLEGMPNLEKLVITWRKISVPLFLNFNPVTSEHCKEIIFVPEVPKECDIDETLMKPFIRQVLKNFPNLVANFENELLDLNLFSVINMEKIIVPLKSIRLYLWPEMPPNYLQNIAEIPQAFLPVVKSLEIHDICYLGYLYRAVTDILSNLAESLESVYLGSYAHRVWDPFPKFSITVPPLLKVRELNLALSPLDSRGEPWFLWNLGTNLANDFPLLESLCLEYNGDDVTLSEFEGDYKYHKHFDIWEPFIPINGKEDVEIVPFKYLKTLDLHLPRTWITDRTVPMWSNELFLKVFKKLYKNVKEDEFIELVRNNL